MPTTHILIFIIFILSFLGVSTLTCIMCIKRNQHRISEDRRQYQHHIDDLVTVLFPTSIPAIHTVPADDTDTTDRYREAEKRKRIADIRTYFNQRKIDAAIAKISGPDELAPVNPYTKQTFLTPPSIERLME